MGSCAGEKQDTQKRKGDEKIMDDKNLITDEELNKLLADLAEEEDEDFSPDFYEHEMERILQRKKELEKEAAELKAQQDKEDAGKRLAEEPGADVAASTDTGNVVSFSEYKKNKTKSLQPQWKAMLSIAAVFVFLICGTLLTRGSLRTNPSTPGGQIVVIDNPGGEPGGNGPEVIDTSDVKNSDSFAVFMQDMWLFIKAALPYLCGAAAIAVIIILVMKKKRSDDK